MPGQVRCAVFTSLPSTTFTIGTSPQVPSFFTTKGGHKMVAVGAKNGYLYGLDRNRSRIAYRVPVTTIENVDAPLTAARTRFCPGTQGGVNWYGPAYSPQQNALYVDRSIGARSSSWQGINLSSTSMARRFSVQAMRSASRIQTTGRVGSTRSMPITARCFGSTMPRSRWSQA